MSRQRLRRSLGYLWAAPCSLLGLLLAMLPLLSGARVRRQQGALEVALPPWRWLQRLPFAAITLGHVILGRDLATLAALRTHEQVHVRQFQRWGLLLLLAYPAASLWLLLRGKRPYWDNPFEVEARRLSGMPRAPRPSADE